MRSILVAAAVGLTASVGLAEPITDPYPQKITRSSHKVALQLVADGLNSPLWGTHASDGSGRLFIADQPGLIRVIEHGKLLEQPWADLTSRIIQLRPAFDERGLLGLAFHPGFARKGTAGFGKLYTFTSEPPTEQTDFRADMEMSGVQVPIDHQGVLAEWSVKPDGSFDPDSRREVMRIDEPQFNHNGGCIVFGPDGMLYLSLADGGQGNDYGPGHTPITGNGQDLTKPLGKILRIDPLGKAGAKSRNGQYAIPADNPFVGGKALPEIWAYGQRNPYRFSFDRKDGRLITGDVGQEGVEEINIITKGGNYGWNFFEGEFYFNPLAEKGANFSREPYADRPTPPADTIKPVAAYDHDEGTSIIGGFVYRGHAIPALEGLYIFGDWKLPPADKKDKSPAGRLFHADLSTGKILEFMLDGQDKLGQNVSGMGEDEAGEVYVLTNDKGGPIGAGGKVFKIVPAK